MIYHLYFILPQFQAQILAQSWQNHRCLHGALLNHAQKITKSHDQKTQCVLVLKLFIACNFVRAVRIQSLIRLGNFEHYQCDSDEFALRPVSKENWLWGRLCPNFPTSLRACSTLPMERASDLVTRGCPKPPLNHLAWVQGLQTLQALDFRAPEGLKCGFLEHFAGNCRSKMLE